ncbi:MAG: GYD domain protein [Acidobacteria bacterium]|nr:MAG: GYD domain protein [Acidobacteriota bacterium]
MAKFLITASYTSEGTRGLLTEGGSGRKAVLEKAIKGLGGTLEAMYFAYGDDDVLLIADVPNAVSGLALSLAANASGTVRVKTTPLITVEEIDAACKTSVKYRGAGAAAV